MFRQTFVVAVSAALLAALAVAPPAGSAPAEQAAFNAASFNDAAGDSGAAPDVTDVAVGNDVVAGPIVFWITLANRPEGLAGEDVAWVVLDTDQNPATGDEWGAEYWIGVDAEGIWLDQWDGADYVEVDAPSLGATFFKGDELWRISIHPDQLGGVSAFDFFVIGENGEDSDTAPNGAPAWRYTLYQGPLILRPYGLPLTPKAPAAGKALSAAMAVSRDDTLDFLGEGKVTCKLTVGGKAVKAVRAGFVQGLAQCRWNLPRAAKGKLVKVTITVSFGRAIAAHVFKAQRAR